MKNLFKTKQNKRFSLIATFVVLFFLMENSYGQGWTSASTPWNYTGTTDYVGIGTVNYAEITSRLNIKGGNINFVTGGSIISQNGYGLGIKCGDATTSTSPVINITGSRTGGSWIPGSVIIQSGDLYSGSSLLSSAPLEVGWNAIGIGRGIDFAKLRTGGYLLGIKGKMIAEEVVVKLYGNWPDFVFAKDYKLQTISELELFIKINKHLPGIPTAKELQEKDGIAVSEMLKMQMQKIEELSLYIIELNNKVAALESKKGGQ